MIKCVSTQCSCCDLDASTWSSKILLGKVVVRVLRCWKYMIPIFSASGNSNYACEAANLLLQHKYTLSPRLSAQLMWSRFVNTTGRPGKNIPVDLHMEHLNKIAKGAIRFQGSNRSKKAIKRIGRAIGTLSPMLDKNLSTMLLLHPADKESLIHRSQWTCQSFVIIRKGRKHRKFPHPKDVLNDKEKKTIVDWLVSKLPTSFLIEPWTKFTQNLLFYWPHDSIDYFVEQHYW